MRVPAGLLLIVLASACAPRDETARIPPPVSFDSARAAGSGLVLAPDGLRPGGSDLRIDFGRAEPGVIVAVSRLLGTGPAARVGVPGCGAGVGRAEWANGLSVYFVDGDFRGWTATGAAAGLPVLPGVVTAQDGTRGAGLTCTSGNIAV